MLTEGKGEDEEEELDGEDESQEEIEPMKKKGKVTVIKPQKKPTTVLTRRTRRGKKEVVLSKPPLTFDERLKQLRIGVGISNFKALKYESRTLIEKKEIEDLVMEKLGTWKFSPE